MSKYIATMVTDRLHRGGNVVFLCSSSREREAGFRESPPSRRSPFGDPWGTLESRKRDHNLEWDEIAIMDDEFRRNEEEDDRD